jgi:hypothetical protein
MRHVAVFLVAIVALAASETTRASSAYASLTTSSAAACARACADDGICMAWNFQRDNQCQLSAVVSGEPGPQALASGFAARAPASLRPQPPSIRAESLMSAPVQIEPLPVIEAAEPDAPGLTAEVDDTVLLGGPGEGDLRLGLR